MIRNLCLAAILLVFSLTGCSSPPPPKKAPPPPPPPTPVKTETPKAETPKPAQPDGPKPEAPKTEAPKTETPKPADPPPAKKEEPKVEAPKSTGSAKDAPLGKETGFEGEFVAGKTVRAWVQVLDSGDKEKMMDAFEALKMVGKRAGSAIPKLEALTQNPDAEIAVGAREALQVVKTKE